MEWVAIAFSAKVSYDRINQDQTLRDVIGGPAVKTLPSTAGSMGSTPKIANSSHAWRLKNPKHKKTEALVTNLIKNLTWLTLKKNEFENKPSNRYPLWRKMNV